MKTNLNKLIIALGFLAIVSCDSLDRFPLDNPSSETFYSSQQEMEVASNQLYEAKYYSRDSERWGDNEWNRSGNGNSFLSGTNTSQTGTFSNAWDASYEAINRANVILENIDKPLDYSSGVKSRIEGEAKFTRAYNYALLAIRFNNVPMVTKSISQEESLEIPQSSKNDILDLVFNDLDDAISLLPWSYQGIQRITKGAALTLKARIALYEGRYAEAAEAAKKVMDSKEYNLYGSYRNLFLSEGQTSDEIIFSLPRSITFSSVFSIRYDISRLARGYASNIPMIPLVDSYECIDGLTIDKSPLYDINNPFDNRDPRLRASIVVPGDEWLNHIFDSRPSAKRTLRLSDNKLVKNNDSKAGNRFASFTGLLKKKSIPNVPDIDWRNQDLDRIIFRYAEVLLIYAEAKIELNSIDQSVLDAINMVRARAYGVAMSDTGNYPNLTTTNQAELRRYLRRERRVEFAFEGLRYRDILRWGIAEDVFNRDVYGYPLVETSGWPLAGIPTFDDNDIPDYSAFASDLNVIYNTVFDASKHYLWAIPFGEFEVNPGAYTQNPNY